MFTNPTVYGRADSSSSATASSTLTSQTSSGSSTVSSVSQTSSGSSAASSISSVTSASSSSSASASTSQSQSSSLPSTTSTGSSSSTSSISSTSSSASASATSTQASSSSSSKSLLGPIIGGAIGGVFVLLLISFTITALRRRYRKARKRPRGSVYIGNMDENQLNAFVGQKPRPGINSVHSSVPLLSVPHVDASSRDETPAEYRDAPAPMPSPYSDHGHGNVTAVPEYLPSPYSQHGHGDDNQDPVPSTYSQHGYDDDNQDRVSDLPPPRILTASPRPESVFYAPIAVQPADMSIRALEEAVAGSRSSRSGTPVSLSMAHA